MLNYFSKTNADINFYWFTIQQIQNNFSLEVFWLTINHVDKKNDLMKFLRVFPTVYLIFNCSEMQFSTWEEVRTLKYL